MQPGKAVTFVLSVLSLILANWMGDPSAYQPKMPSRQADDQAATPTPTYDPLEIPILPKNPTLFDSGSNLYYYHCMPCHGDTGQGLTDAWRMVWEDDHRNCWGRGCHGGRMKDEGFPIPTVVPAIMAPEDLLENYPDIEALFQYLKETHPPQKPGRLKDGEYQALAVFLWISNNRQMPEDAFAQATIQPTDKAIDKAIESPKNTPTDEMRVATTALTVQASATAEEADKLGGEHSKWNTKLTGGLAGTVLILAILIFLGLRERFKSVGKQ